MTKNASLPLAVFLFTALPLVAACPKGGGGGGLDCVDGFVEDPQYEVCVAVLPAEDCPAGTRAQVGQADCLPVGNVACAAGFQTVADGWGCEPVLPAGPCDPGTRPALGETACVPVGHTTCAPPLGADPGGWGCVDLAPAAPCTGATRATLDGRGCVPIGDCSAAFPPADTTFHVNAAFTDPELDASHYRVLNDALAQARGGDLVAIYPGTYVDEISAYPGVKIVGKCAEEVILDVVPGSTQPGALMFDGKIDIEGITFTGHLLGAAVLQQGQMVLTEVLIEANQDLGLYAADAGSEIVLRRSVVRGTRPSAGKTHGWGGSAEPGGRIVLEESELVDNLGTGLFATGGASLEIVDSIIWNTTTDTGGRTGHGVHVQSGATALLRGSLVAGSHTLGLYASSPGTEVRAENTVVRDTLPNGAGAFGIGAQVDFGASLTLVDSTIARSAVMGIFAMDTRTTLDLERVTLRHNPTTPQPGGTRALMVQQGPTVTATDLAIFEAAEAAVVVAGAGANATIDGLMIRDTRPSSLGESGQGLWVVDAAQATVSDGAILDNRTRGVIVMENGASATFDGLIVEGTIPSSPTARPDMGGIPMGFDVHDGGNATCRRCLIRGNEHIGVRVTRAEGGDEPASLVLEDSVVADTVHDPVGDQAGLGLVVYLDGTATVSRTTFARNSTTGVLVSSQGAQLSLADSTIKETRPGRGYEAYGLAVQVKAAASVSSLASVKNDGFGAWAQGVDTRLSLSDSLFGYPEGLIQGIGVAAQDGASLDLLRSEVARNKVAGVAAAFPGTLLFVDQTLVRDSHPSSEGIADGVVLWSNVRATLSRSVIQNNEAIGVKVLTAAARLSWVEVRENTVGIHVTGGTAIETGATVPADYESNVAFVADSCSFIDNATRTGTGAVAVPQISQIPVDPS
ncbi:MAG: right-handed parallel beta-helix repeat-containing protein [Deltaproteobacteria bacterium]|nr:right-handed parallel beta-helix repeat-containing protein [Deltaproteobacteria bacterium]